MEDNMSNPINPCMGPALSKLPKVHELANRGVTLTSLLKFWHLLMEQQVGWTFTGFNFDSIDSIQHSTRILISPSAACQRSQVMPSFDPHVSTTNDVVRLVTCPQWFVVCGRHGISESKHVLILRCSALVSLRMKRTCHNLSRVKFVSTTLFDSEAVIPLSQDPSTGEGLTFWVTLTFEKLFSLDGILCLYGFRPFS